MKKVVRIIVISFINILFGLNGVATQSKLSNSYNGPSEDGFKILQSAMVDGYSPNRWSKSPLYISEIPETSSYRRKISPIDERLTYLNVSSLKRLSDKRVRGVAVDYGSEGNPIPVANILSVDFVFSGQEFVFTLHDTGSSLNQPLVYIEVDGKLCSDLGYKLLSKFKNKEHNIKVSFKQRVNKKTVRLVFSGFKDFGGIALGNHSELYKHRTRNESKVIVFGDSYTAGGGADFEFVKFYAYRLGKLMGWKNTIVSGCAGTGYVNPWKRQNYLQRVNDIISACPDAVVITGGINDTKYASAEAVQNNARTLFQTIRKSLPKCAIIVLSPFWPKRSNYPYDYKKAIADATEGINGVLFIDIGTSFIFNDTLDVKSHLLNPDNVHPNVAGHILIANEISIKLKQAITNRFN